MHSTVGLKEDITLRAELREIKIALALCFELAIKSLQ